MNVIPNEEVQYNSPITCIHVADLATEKHTYMLERLVLANLLPTPHPKAPKATHLIGLNKLSSSKHGGQGDVVHANITGKDGGDLGILHSFGGGGRLGGDTAVGHGRLGGKRGDRHRPWLGRCRRGEGIGAREEGNSADSSNRESHLDGFALKKKKWANGRVD